MTSSLFLFLFSLHRCQLFLPSPSFSLISFKCTIISLWRIICVHASATSIILSVDILTLNEKQESHSLCQNSRLHCCHLSLSLPPVLPFFHLHMSLYSVLTDCQHSTLWRETVAMAINSPTGYLLYIYRTYDIAWPLNKKSCYWLYEYNVTSFSSENANEHIVHAVPYKCKINLVYVLCLLRCRLLSWF